jgi:thiosulfate dehydrogenase [quinone] large subunit
VDDASKPEKSSELNLSTTPPTTITTAPSGSSTTTPTTSVSPGALLGSAAEVPDNAAATFTIGSNGEPGIVIHTLSGNFVAYNAVCPHMGCTVGYSSANKIMICPCHGSEFEVSTGDVIVGPAPHGLTKLRVVEGTNGNLYLQ